MNDCLNASCARALARTGTALVPIDKGRVVAFWGMATAFQQRRQERMDAAQFQFQRTTETEPELGIMSHDGSGGKDKKWLAHIGPDLEVVAAAAGWAWTEDDLAFVRAAEDLRQHALELTLAVIDCFDQQNGTGLRHLLVEGAACPVAWGHSCLRLLDYPPSEEETIGAKPHLDRSLITSHFGDEGGKLEAMSDRSSQTGRSVSPPEGYMLLLFGVKVLEATGGRFGPLWHRSVRALGQRRRAIVAFHHANVGVEVTDAGRAYQDFHIQVRESDMLA